MSNTGQVIAVRSHDVRGAGSGSLAAYPNAVVITDGIAEVRSASIVTDIYATAFHIGDAFDAMDIRGVGGESMVQYVDPRSAATLSRLAPREREVLAELATGFSNRTVAQRLVLSQRAVEKHINSIFAKLGFGWRTFSNCQAPPRDRVQSRRPATVPGGLRRSSCAGAGRILPPRKSGPLGLCRFPRPASIWRGVWPNCSLAPSTCPRVIRRNRRTDGADRCSSDIRSAASWSLPARLLLAQSYCVLGRVEPCAEMVAEPRIRYGSRVEVFGPQLRIAEARLAAARRNVSAANDLALDAARRAEESDQRAIEMLALHDAVRYR